MEEGTPHIIRGKIPIPDFPEPIIEPFTHDEIKALLVAADHSKPWKTRRGKTAQSKRPTANRDRAIILTLLDTGIRAQELCDLTIADYDQKRGRLHVRHGKGDKQRFLFLGDRCRKALWRYLADRQAKPGAPLFTTRTGEHMERNNLRHTLQRIAEQAEVPNVYPHRFRHTFAINYLRNGGNVFALKEILGHESLDTVLIYVKMAELDLELSQKHSPVDNWKL
jgi:integrase/recombinase XerD